MNNSTNCSFFKYSKEFEEESFFKTIRDDYLIVENIYLTEINSV